MKKLLLMKTALLLFALVVGSGSVWADETAEFDFTSSQTSPMLNNGVTFTWTSSNIVTGATSATSNGFKSNSNMTVTLPSGATLTKIEKTNGSLWGSGATITVYAGSSNQGTSIASIVSGTNSYNISSNNTGGTFYFANSTSKNAWIKSLKITYTISGGGGGGSQTPSIDLGTTTVNATKEAVSTTSINVTYNHLTNYNADVIFYESDGTTYATYDHSWLTAEINASTKKLDYSISANTGLERKAYLKVYASGDEGKVESDLITVTQKGAYYKVYIQAPTGGTLEVKNGGTPVSDGDAIADGTQLTITPTAADGYRFKNWQAVDASTHTFTAANATTYTINAHDVTIKANFDVEYSVNWSVNGNVTSTGFIENETIVFPNRPADIVGKKFVGWTASEIVGTQADVPTLINYGTKMGTSNLTYYAVFADASGASSTATLTGSEISSNLASAQMSYGTEKTYTDTSDGVTWVGCGNTDAASRPWVQLRSKADAYFKISTLKNIEEVKLTISNTNNQAGGITDISKHGAFAGTVCIESAAQSTPTGVYASSNVVSNNIVTVSLPVSLKEFYIQTTAGARVWGIELTTNNYTYSNYRTTVPTTATITLNAACTDGSLVYGTYSNSQAFVVPADLVVSEIKVDNGKLQLSDYSTDDVVPANTGVLVAALAGGNYDVTLSAEAGTSVLGNGNMLKASGDAGITADGMSAAASGCIYYRLTMHNGTQLGFWWGAENGASFALAANKAYLAVPTSSARDGLWIDDDATALTLVNNEKRTVNNEYFDLQGRKVTNPTKGLYIVNGRKVVVK